jgi:hypothetical protein
VTHVPPVPQGNQSPYPIAEPPHVAPPPRPSRATERTIMAKNPEIVAGVAVAAVAAISAVGLAAYLFIRRNRGGKATKALPRRANSARLKVSSRGAARVDSGPKRAAEAQSAPVRKRSSKAAKSSPSEIRPAVVRGNGRAGKSHDNTAVRGPHDASRIAMSEDYEVVYWTKKFGVDRAALQRAVDAVGTGSKAIAEHLSKS